MQELFATGRIADIVLVLMLLEGIALTALYRTRHIGIDTVSLWINLAAGAALFLALKSALTHQEWTTTAAYLVAGLIAHVADLAARWRR